MAWMSCVWSLAALPLLFVRLGRFTPLILLTPLLFFLLLLLTLPLFLLFLLMALRLFWLRDADGVGDVVKSGGVVGSVVGLLTRSLPGRCLDRLDRVLYSTW
jgi:hypothetical protein